ncbi:heat shock protein Hsp18 [Haloimpatiens lingqiaonensis]|uniref:heat shock protein Hsp18 n=1 Tax=Haloimpatiens lingqiaonensis TaxID=1380675 RepID=UPI0010FDB3D4|nr:heat shock protein Hsp18 [Haloimpatiens lingqiaonensis]
MFDLVPFRKNNMMKRDDYFNKFFDNFFKDDFFASNDFMGNSFKVDVKETDDSYTMEAELPGITKDAINIEYTNNYLTICAKKENTVEDTSSNYVRREISYGEFKRSFYVDNVDDQAIKAEFSNGILKIALPKKEKGNNNIKRIEIQ